MVVVRFNFCGETDMTVKHIVLIQLNQDVDEQAAQGLFSAISPLLQQIPGVLDVSAGENFTNRAPEVSHAMVVTLESKGALEGYGPHPKHVEVQGIMKPLIKSVSAVDIEV